MTVAIVMNEVPGHDIQYIGDELEVFGLATNWKAYLRNTLSPYIAGDVAEVGAGIGTTYAAIGQGSKAHSWLCIEPDGQNIAKIGDLVRQEDFAPEPAILHGTLDDVASTTWFDTIVYVDVLEHIESDRAELELAWSRLRPGGRLVVLCPAFQFLFSPFDAAIGHFRRYSRKSLETVGPAGAAVVMSRYRDSVGFFASVANKLLLKQSMPQRGQVLLWDRVMVPMSRIVDPLFGKVLGKSVVVVWQKPR